MAECVGERRQSRLGTLSQILSQSPAGRAVVAFTCYDVETALGVMRAAVAAQTPVIALIGKRSYTGAEGRSLAVAIKAVLEATPIPTCLQLDHCDDLDVISNALDDGFSAIMADGSTLDFERNVDLVRNAVALSAGRADVEAELGRLTGDEDVASPTTPGAYTDPVQAGKFVRLTDAACLAVSIGNVHGSYLEAPQLDWPRLEQIRSHVTRPLALHGASGLGDAVLATAVRRGIKKINVNTELREAYLSATEAHLPKLIAGAQVAALHEAQTDSIEAIASQKLEICGRGLT